MKILLPFIKALCFIPLFADAQTSGNYEAVWLNQAQAYLEWTGTAQGILPSLTGQLSVDAAYGFTVAGLGDVNGDGYDDAAIGAPGLADIITGSGNLAGVGAVFIYYGSSSGLPVAPSKKLQPTTAVSGALFGYSICGGDITGDGKNDIIIGAPMDSYQTSAKGLLSNPTVTVRSGKVYIYRSEDLSSSSNPSPFLQLKLEGINFFSTGVVGLLLSNITSTNLFGFSVAVTDDLNKDGKKDIIIGCPTFLGIQLLTVKQGAAFVYYSNNLSAAPVQLDLPTTSLLGLSLPALNLGGLLFGYSVDGIGDYNSDGNNDVVVGAPAGINLSSLGGVLTGQILGGSAYVYYGKSAGGINATIGATLHADATGLLSNTANLFGYNVKGVKNSSGVRTGKILVGAPLGGAVTNLLGGLQVKTGTVSVFKNGSASGIITPDQQLSSPRNDNNILGIIQSNLLFGFSIDNTADVNCDGIADIIVGEPASSGAKLIGANIAGGSAYIYAGKSDGTYQSTPVWGLGVSYDAALGVNLVSLAGYSVAGVGKVKGAGTANKILVGAPGRSLDFGAGLLNLGNTASTLFGLVAGDNGIGKSYSFDSRLCMASNASTLPLRITAFNARQEGTKDVLLTWEVSSEQGVSHYSIEKSLDGSNWKTITIVLVLSENGEGKSYSVKDSDIYRGVSYYRLKQTDIDEQIFYSSTRMINIKQTVKQTLTMTNPFNHSIKVQFESQTDNIAELKLTDLSGKIIIYRIVRTHEGNNVFQMDGLSALAPGVYIMHVLNGTNYHVQKLLKSGYYR